MQPQCRPARPRSAGLCRPEPGARVNRRRHAEGVGLQAREVQLSNRAEVPLGEHLVRVEFDHLVTRDDFVEDLAGNSRHRLLDFLPQVTTNLDGRIELRLNVPGLDVWASVLTAMSVVRQSGYEPVAVHVTCDHVNGEHTLVV